MPSPTIPRHRIAHRKRGAGPSPRLSVRLAPESHAKLLRIARRRGITVTALVVPILAEYADKHAPAVPS